MPNIEIHGMDRKEAENLREKIFEELSGEPYLKETVITICPSIVRDSKGEYQPFLRLIDDVAGSTTRKILAKLIPLKLDIEFLKLYLFSSKIT